MINPTGRRFPDPKGIIGDHDTWPVAKQSGKLVPVQVRPGVYIKMYEDEAIAKGLWPPPEMKMQEPVRNKMRRVSRNKGEG